MLAAKEADQFTKLRERFGDGEQDMLFGVEVIADLLLEEAGDFRLPQCQVDIGVVESAVDADAECEGMLVLAGKRYQGGVAKHGNIVTPLYENTLAG